MNIKNLQKFLFIFMLISTLLLTACGGGSSGSGKNKGIDEAEIIGTWYLNYEDELPVIGDKIPTIKFDANKTCSIVDYELNKYNDNKYWEGKGEPENANGTWGISDGLVKVTVDGFTTSIEFDHESLRMSGENEGDKSIWTSEYKRQKYAETPKKDDPKKDEPTKDDPSKDTKMYSGGSGTVSDPYKIANATDLYNVRYNLGANFIQIADVDLSSYNSSYICDYDGYSGKGWVPIGEGDTSDKSKYFSGSYDGKGYKIKNLYISRQAGIGLFKQISEKAELANINVEISDDGLSGTGFIGALAGCCFANTVTGCMVTSKIGLINGRSAAVGGLFGYSSSNISNCDTRVGIQCTALKSGNDEGGIGGLVGIYVGSNSINDCYADIFILSDVDKVGGLIGFSESSGVISKCIASGPIVISGVNVGGLVGYNKSYIDHCVSYSNVSGLFAAGGFVGLNTGKISMSCAYGNAMTTTSSAEEESAFCGGFVGYNRGSISDCYSEGSALSTSNSSLDSVSCTGGFAGSNDSGASLYRCYSTGNVSCMHSGAGGISGINSGIISNCVALGEKVLSAKSNTQGRITGTSRGTIISCYAIDTMKVGSSVPKVNIGLNLINGASIKESDAKNPNWWKNTAGWSESTWIFSTTGYPTLKDMPSLN